MEEPLDDPAPGVAAVAAETAMGGRGVDGAAVVGVATSVEELRDPPERRGDDAVEVEVVVLEVLAAPAARLTLDGSEILATRVGTVEREDLLLVDGEGTTAAAGDVAGEMVGLDDAEVDGEFDRPLRLRSRPSFLLLLLLLLLVVLLVLLMVMMLMDRRERERERERERGS